MLDLRELPSNRGTLSAARRQGQPWRWRGFLLVCLLACLLSGCPAPVSLQVPLSLPETLNVPQAQSRLKETLMRAIRPEILEVDVNTDFVIYRYRQAIAVPTMKPLTENRIALLNIGRVEVFSNNVVLLWTPSNLLLGQIIFGNYQDPTLCANLLLFLRDQRSRKG